MKRRQCRRIMKQMVGNSTVVTVSRVGRSSKSEQWDDTASPDFYPLLIPCQSFLNFCPTHQRCPRLLRYVILASAHLFHFQTQMICTSLAWHGKAKQEEEPWFLKAAFEPIVFLAMFTSPQTKLCAQYMTSRCSVSFRMLILHVLLQLVPGESFLAHRLHCIQAFTILTYTPTLHGNVMCQRLS